MNKNKIIKRVLGRLISEECTKLKEITKNINELSHQLEEYPEMIECYKNIVREKMFEKMLDNGWKDWVKELKEELDA